MMQFVDFSTLNILDYIVLACYAAIAIFGVIQIVTRKVIGSKDMSRYTPESVKVYAILSGVSYFLGGGGAAFCSLLENVNDSIPYLVLAGGLLLTIAANFAVLKKQ